MDRNLIKPPQDNLYIILDTIHEDLCDIQATIREQNDLLDKLVNPPHNDLKKEKTYKYCEEFYGGGGMGFSFEKPEALYEQLYHFHDHDKINELIQWCYNSKIGDTYHKHSICINVYEKIMEKKGE